MRRLYILAGCALAAFLDFSVGVFIVYLLAPLFGYETAIHDYILGGIFALLPDFDFLYVYLCYIRAGKTPPSHHTFITHRPLFTILLGFAMGIWLGDLFWMVTAPICVFWHFVHDTEGFLSGSGIAWFWPFSREYWTPLLVKRNPNAPKKWLTTTWLAPTNLSVTEIFIGSLLLGWVAGDIIDKVAAPAVVFTAWLGTAFIWISFPFIAKK